MSAFEELMGFQKQTEALAQVAGRLGWDQETIMPEGSAEQRSEEMSAIEAILHGRRTDAKVGDWLAKIDDDALDQVGQAQMRHIRHNFNRSRRVPSDLAAELARVTSLAQGIWARARADDDFASFAPTLEEVVKLRQEEGAALADGGDVYDALLQGYEPDATAVELDAMFTSLRPGLVDLRNKILGQPDPGGLDHEFAEAQQLALSQKMAQVFGYDFRRGRIDKAVHPFSSGSGNDVRITTRTALRDPFNCIYSTIHEVGHATYEQSIDQAYLLSPLGAGVSMGVHESQSRIYENQLGRSQAFTGWLFDQMKDQFGEFGIADERQFYKVVNRIGNGYIRTEADEVQYNLHVMMRFDLERSLISGELKVADLEAAWNSRFEADFGFAVDRASNGVLQDVHWSVGLFGYFPTYSIGNVYAGCLHDALVRDVPDLDAQLRAGDLMSATDWLKSHVQRHGGLYRPRDLIARACGTPPSEAPLLTYLNAKFTDLYDL